MRIKLLLLLDCINLILSAILSSNAVPPANAKQSLFTALLYTQKEIPSDTVPYPDLIGQCTGALIADKWIITSTECLVMVDWKVAIGLNMFFKQNVQRRYNFNIRYIVDSIVIDLKLVQMDRAVEASIAQPITIHPFSFINSHCYAAFWMNDKFRNNTKHPQITKKLHGYFNQKLATSCNDNTTGMSEILSTSLTVLCLIQRNVSDPIKLCKNDLGAPFVCDGYIVGIITNIQDMHCYNNNKADRYPVTVLGSHTTWINYFTKRDIDSISSQECLISSNLILIISLIVMYFLIL